MKLPAAFTTVTPFSKIVALILFATLPIIGFQFGRYYESLSSVNYDRYQVVTPPLVPTVTKQLPDATRLPAVGEDVLVTVVRSGGLCPNSVVCNSTRQIFRDGTQTKIGTLSTNIDKAQFDTLINQIDATDYAAIKAIKFTGTCPTAFDGQEVTYTFYTSHGREDLKSCTYDLNRPIPLLATVENILNPNRGPR